MTQSRENCNCLLRLTGTLVVSSAVIASVGNCALAQIKSDATLGPERSTVTRNIPIRGLPSDQINGGARRGANLFHSFQQFNVDAERGAYFANPRGVKNILSRVTGDSPSNIFGKLGVLGNANLFLINPNGIVFGLNASLDVNGSFVATTANAIEFGSQGFFNASDPNVPSLLTVNPSAFLFNQIAVQSITVNSRREVGFITIPGLPPVSIYEGLEVPDGKSLLLLGGDVKLEGGILSAPGGRIDLGGAAGAGTVGLNVDGDNLSLNFPQAVQRADVTLDDDADVNAIASDGGSIAINAQNLSLAGKSSVRAGIASGLGSIDSKAGDIEIDTTGEISLTDGSFVSNAVLDGAVGQGGDINITAGSLALTNQAFVVTSLLFGQGDAGDITIAASETVSATNGSYLGTSTLGQGDAGDITITASGVVSVGRASYVSTDVSLGAVGNSGNINITAKSLFFTNGGDLSTNTFGQGNAGNINITVRDTASFDGVGPDSGVFDNDILPSGAFSGVGAEAKGDGGNINIEARSLFFTNGASLSVDTEGWGDAGNVTIKAHDIVSFDGVETVELTRLPSGLFSQVTETAEGSGGSINITTRALFVTNGAQLSTSNDGTGAAGNLEVSAGSIRLDNQAALSSDTTGGQGNINLSSQDLILLRNSTITTNAQGKATGGNIVIGTGVLTALENSDISADAEAAQGGQVSVDAQGIFRSPDSNITASSDLGPEFSGTVEINTPDVDPNKGVAKLPDALANVAVAQGCQGVGGKQASVEFFNTGKGGLAPNPYEPLSSSEVWEDMPHRTRPLASATRATEPASPPNKIVEAQGWLTNEKGEAVLVAEVPTPHPQHRCHLR